MGIEELPLVIFTVLAQMGLGGFIVLIYLKWYAKTESEPVITKGIIASGILAVLALVAATSHLGNPWGAYRSIVNFANSWLSREIFFYGMFLLSLFLGIVIKKSQLKKTLEGISVFSAVLAIFSMASIYVNTMIPAWNALNTYIVFFGTAFLLGSTGVGILFSLYEPKQEERLRVANLAGLLSLGALTVELVALPSYLVYLSSGSIIAAQTSAFMLSQDYGGIFAVRWGLALIGGAFPLVLLLRKTVAGRIDKRLLYAAFGCFLCSELIGRFLFYATGILITG